MSASLPLALRVRFEECIKEGLSRREAAARLKLPSTTWRKMATQAVGDGFVPARTQSHRPGHEKLSRYPAFLEELVAQDGDINLPQPGGALEATAGVAAHSASFGRFLRKLGYTYKKSRWLPPNGCAPM